MCPTMNGSEIHQLPSQNLGRLRIEAGFTRSGLARAASVSRATVRVAEDDGRVPRPPQQKRIAQALSLTLYRRVDALDIWPLVEDGKAA